MSKVSPRADIEVYLKGVYPERIPVRLLSDALSAVYRLACPSLIEDEAELAPFRLLNIRRGSACFRCVSDDATDVIAGLRTAGSVLRAGQDPTPLARALSPIRTLSKVATRLGSPIVIRNPENSQDILATILPESYESISRELVVSGPKQIRGVVQRVGGVTRTKCAIRIDERPRLLICVVRPRDLANRLGQFLYRRVTVSGNAKWIKTNWELVSFEITQIEDPDPSDLDGALNALRRAGADAWDEVADPAKYLDEMSGKR